MNTQVVTHWPIIASNYVMSNHDFSICVIHDWELKAISLERIDRVKRSPRPFCDDLAQSKDKQCYYLLPVPYFLENFRHPDKEFVNFPNYSDEYHIKHHFLHACSAYYPSQFEEAAILCVDGHGQEEYEGGKKSVVQSWRYARGKEIENIFRSAKSTENHGGIGICYTLISNMIGLEVWSTMWLAAYGNHERYAHIDFFVYDEEEVKISKQILELVDGYEEMSTREFLDYDSMDNHRENFDALFAIQSQDYEDKESDMSRSIFIHIAAKLQYETERAMVYLAQQLYKKTSTKNLCLAWGVALNICANSCIRAETWFENIFIQAAATDDGLSLGAAYYHYHTKYPSLPRIPMLNAALGKSYSEKEILASLLSFKDVLEYSYDHHASQRAAQAICEQKIIGWFHAGSEFGPRALWNRSIFADSSSASMKDRVNDIKKRQKWRPFAPLLLEEDLDLFFEDAIPNYFMTLSWKVKEDMEWTIPAGVHADGTARYQTINETQNKKCYDMLRALKELKGNSVIINTSFNTYSEPIVETAEQAICMFLSTKIDILILENFVVTKKQLYPEFAFCPDMSPAIHQKLS